MDYSLFAYSIELLIEKLQCKVNEENDLVFLRINTKSGKSHEGSIVKKGNIEPILILQLYNSNQVAVEEVLYIPFHAIESASIVNFKKHIFILSNEEIDNPPLDNIIGKLELSRKIQAEIQSFTDLLGEKIDINVFSVPDEPMQRWRLDKIINALFFAFKKIITDDFGKKNFINKVSNIELMQSENNSLEIINKKVLIECNIYKPIENYFSEKKITTVLNSLL